MKERWEPLFIQKGEIEMANMLVYDNIPDELEEVAHTTKELSAYYSAENWNVDKKGTMVELKEYIEKDPLIHMACYDVTSFQNINYLRETRKNYKEAMLMLLADDSMSPMEYIKPEILASELLLRPFPTSQLKGKLKEMMDYYQTSKEEASEDKIFCLETKEGVTRIPYRRIMYFEAKEKKVYMRTSEQKEYPFRQTIEELDSKLPETFMRCHRSFIVNKNMIEQILLSKGNLVLRGGTVIPFARAYKEELKNLGISE